MTMNTNRMDKRIEEQMHQLGVCVFTDIPRCKEEMQVLPEYKLPKTSTNKLGNFFRSFSLYELQLLQ